MKKTFETQDFYVSFLNCNQKSTVYSHLMNVAHTAEKNALQDFGKVPATDTVVFGQNFVFYGTVFLKALTILKPSSSAQLFLGEQCNVLIIFQYFFCVVSVEKADGTYLKPRRSVFNDF